MTQDSPSPSSPKTRRWIFGVVALLLLVAVGGGIWAWYRFRVWPEETRRVLERKNLAVAYLENEQFDRCDPLFVELGKEWPNELLPARNLAISRVLKVKATGPTIAPQKFAKALAEARVALERLQALEGNTAVVQLLTGRLAGYADDEDTRLKAYSEAAKLDPESPAAWGELFLAARASFDPVRRIQAREALKRAYALQPNNLFLLLEMLSLQSQQKDAEIAETLAFARKVVAPFAGAISRRSQGRTGILEFIDEALAALHRKDNQPPDWNRVSLQTAYLVNVLRPENAHQRDLKRIERYELEYIISDFSPEFYEEVYLPKIFDSPPIAVTFKQLDAIPAFEQLTEIRQAQLIDFDLDGRLDVLVVRSAAVEVFGRNADQEWQSLAAIDVPAGMKGAIAADLDRDFREAPTWFQKSDDPDAEDDSQKTCLDADPDICIYGERGMVILKNVLDQNTGQRTLERVPQSEAFQNQKQIQTAAFADLDQDGDLDLVASGAKGLSLWLNLDNSLAAEGFDDITSRSAMPPEEFHPSVIIPVDWDRNVAMDLVLLDGETRVAGWLENLQHGRFRWLRFGEDTTLGQTAALLDVDANASWDLLVANPEGISTVLTKTPASGVVRIHENKPVHKIPAEGLLPLDYDNDGVMDFLAWNGDGEALCHGLPNGQFDATNLFEEPPPRIQGGDVGDLDQDGDQDLLLYNKGQIVLYSNEGGNQNAWIDIALRADQNPQFPAERCNMAGIGSLLEVKAGLRSQSLVATNAITHFGLGQRQEPDLVRVLWTNGIPENIIHPKTKTLICDEQKLKGSCPYLYTWDGEKFVFHTDLLWAAPIGLQFAEHELAPAREWEYLLIEGEKLKPHNGEYQLQITEELWEAAYFDLVELIAVDHPANVEVYSNEKVGPSNFAEPKLHTVTQRRVPQVARDQKGRDVLPKIAKRDGDYLQAFDRRIKQGLTEEHFLELNLGNFDDPQTISLFLTGWVFPTDTSLNVGIGHNPTVSSPRPPSLLTPDADGQWREVMGYIGFPGGKTKTIAVEVPSKHFTHGDYRLRIATSMQIAWDEVFFTVDAPRISVKQQPLKLLAADLHFRGYSKIVPHQHGGPDRYDYQTVTTEPQWPPMNGNFTRFGDVTKLVQTADDRLVILGAGDEMTLRFQAPPPPPAGWKRSFLLHNIGWDKDADLNTVHGETVEPLPFRGMKRYPYEPDQTAPDSEAYREYLQKYQTRKQSFAQFWKRLTAP